MLLLRGSHSLRPCMRYLTSSAVTLSGHNKWSKIKEGKGANDQLKSKIYSKANRDIIFAARKGDSADPVLNSALATAISKAKSNGVPKANIQAALDQARKSKNNDGQEYQYEVLFAGKVGLVVECYSDNGTRLMRELRPVIKKHGAQLAAVAYMFEKKATIRVRLEAHQLYEDLWINALDNGALDLSDAPADDADVQQRVIEIETSPDQTEQLAKRLESLDYSILDYETTRMPLDVGVSLDDETREAVRVLIDDLEENPDVHRVLVSPEL